MSGITFDIEFEETVLAKALKDVPYLKKASRILEAHHFGTKYHSWLWGVVKETWDKYRELASAKIVINRARRDFADEDDREPYIKLAKRLFKMKPDDAGAALDALGDFVRMVVLQTAMEQAADDLEKSKIDDAYAVMRRPLEREVRTTQYTLERWIEGFDERQAARKHRKEHPEEYPTIPTGFPTIDRIMEGGMTKGEMGIIMATTGRGKSIMTNNIAFTSVKKKHPCLVIGFEMPAAQIAQRQDARWLQIPYRKFKTYDFTPGELRAIERRLRKIRKRWANLLHIASMPIRTADMTAVKAILDDLWVEHKFRPEVLILDSADHLLPVGRSESHRLDQAAIYWSAKALAEEEGMVVWSTTQAGKEYAKQLATSEATSESYDKARIADVIISLNEPKRKARKTIVVDDDDDGAEFDDAAAAEDGAGEIATRGRLLELFLAKYRDGQSQVTVPVDAQLERMYISEVEVEREES